MTKRLNIVVPYRNREAHLAQLLPHLALFFARDKIDRGTPYRVLIVEQDGALPLNRGALKNIGFLLGRDDSDYTCFHDVDLLPIWADYSWSEKPAPIAWHGIDVRPVNPSHKETGYITSDPEVFFGGVVLTPNDLFKRVNGYSNAFWGWGYEDEDLRRRFEADGTGWTRRRGTFQPIHHHSEGYEQGGKPSRAAEINRRLLEQKWLSRSNGASAVADDGLSTTGFAICDRRALSVPHAERTGAFEKVTVRLTMQPSVEQMAEFTKAASPAPTTFSSGWRATITL